MKLNIVNKSKNEFNDVIYHDVVILSAGVWGDQSTPSKINYKSDVLERYCKNWKRDFIYVTHTKRADGVPVNAFNVTGFVENPHFDKDKNAVVADLRIIGSTAIGKDVIDFIDRGVIQYLSPEVKTWEKHNYYTNLLDVEKLEFNGVALVIDNPACKTTRIDRFKKTVAN